MTTTVVPLENPSYANAVAAGIVVGDPVVVLCEIPLFFRYWTVKRTLTLTNMNLSGFTVTNTKNNTTQTFVWSSFYGYFEST